MEVEDGNDESPHSESTKAENNDDPGTCDDQKSPHLRDSNHPDVKGPEYPIEGHFPEEQDLAESSFSVDVAVETAARNTEKLEDTNVGSPIQADTTIPCERSVETKPEDVSGEELKSGARMDLPLDNETKQNELTNGVTGMQLLTDDEREEDQLENGVSGMELPPKRERKEEELINGVAGVDSPPKTETNAEVNIGVKRMKLPQTKEELNNAVTGMELEPLTDSEIKEELLKPESLVGHAAEIKSSTKSFLLDPLDGGGYESGVEEEQVAFMKELEMFHRERCLEFKPPKFYGEPLNCLKLWRAVIRLGGYEQVTSCKLWRQVGESFKPPKTCTTVSWTFRCFYEKSLLEYEKHQMRCGELPFSDASFTEPTTAANQVGDNQSLGSGRARRDAAARAMQGWHSQRLLSNGEVGDPIIKDKNASSTLKREKQLKSIGLLKRKKSSPVERAIKVARLKASKPQLDTLVVDVGPPADWVKINVQRTKDCFEVYALVPGLLREEVRVQSDPAGRLVISGQPEQLDNPWGVTPFKKVVSLPSRIDPHQTSAVVTLHGQLFVRVPFEQSDL